MPNIAIKDMLKWIDSQRDVVNTLINVAPPDRKDQYMPELYVINAIAERVQEMTAVEYLDDIRAIKRICANRAGCRGCPFDAECPFVSSTQPHRAVEIVKRWKEERDEQ